MSKNPRKALTTFENLCRKFKDLPWLYRLSSPGELESPDALRIVQEHQTNFLDIIPQRKLRKHGQYWYAVIERFWLVLPLQPRKPVLIEVNLPGDLETRLSHGIKINVPLGVIVANFCWNLVKYGNYPADFRVNAFLHSHHDQGLNYNEDAAARIIVYRFAEKTSFTDLLRQWKEAHASLFPND